MEELKKPISARCYQYPHLYEVYKTKVDGDVEFEKFVVVVASVNSLRSVPTPPIGAPQFEDRRVYQLAARPRLSDEVHEFKTAEEAYKFMKDWWAKCPGNIVPPGLLETRK